MNTLRFFLLLVSVFLLAFIFQLDSHIVKSPQEVLSQRMVDKSSESTFSTYVYPHADIISSGDDYQIVKIDDTFHAVALWYTKLLLQKQLLQDKGSAERNQTLLVSGLVRNKKIIVKITKKIDEKFVFVTISVNPS